MTARIVLLLSLCAAACAPNVRAQNLAEVNLADMAVVQELGSRLNPEDRALFSTYVAIHAPSGPGFCGERLVDAAGREPATVGEAIAFTRIREANDRARATAAARPKTAAELEREARAMVLAQRDMLRDRQSMLLSRHGDAARELPEWRELEQRLAGLNSPD